MQPPFIVPGEEYPGTTGFTYDQWLDPQYKNLPPTPSANMEGKLMEEQYLNTSNQLIRSTKYKYSLSEYSNSFFSIKAIQNRLGGFDANGNDCGQRSGMSAGGLRPVNLFVSPAKSFYTLLDTVIETAYANGAELVQKKLYTYDAKYQIRSESVFNSDQSVTRTSYTRPIDYLTIGINGNTTLVQEMTGRNMNDIIISSRVAKDGIQLDSIHNLFHKPSSGVFVPQHTKIQVENNPMEIRQLYNLYDSYGHLLEKQQHDGAKESYLWGYDAHFPVAKVVGADYNAIASVVDVSVLNNPSTDAALRAELNKIRVQLPQAIVVTYTYDLVNGITSVTDPSGKTNYYEYDNAGRLYMVKDQNAKIVKRYCYNYVGQSEECGGVTLSSQMNTGAPWLLALSNGAGYTKTFNLYSASSLIALGTVPPGIYSVSLNPMYSGSVTSPVQLTINASTYTGNAFSLSALEIFSATTFQIAPLPAAGPCSFAMSTGYSTPTNSLSATGGNASGYLVFYYNSAMNAGNNYQIATINGGCRPSGTRYQTIVSGGRTWNLTIHASGAVYAQLAYGSASVSPYSTVSLSNISFSL